MSWDTIWPVARECLVYFRRQRHWRRHELGLRRMLTTRWALARMGRIISTRIINTGSIGFPTPRSRPSLRTGVYRLYPFDTGTLADGLSYALRIRMDSQRDYWIE